ncbi:uridine phosphorylase [Lacticaseibacillus rhamnosus MTCC 5462]|nr:uridine phosphorylase [Lacticaseibacillus rhamnosus MTCC 5462]
MVNRAMARTSGLMGDYVPDSYPAVADPLLVNKIYTGAVKMGLGFIPV